MTIIKCPVCNGREIDVHAGGKYVCRLCGTSWTDSEKIEE